MQDIIELRVDPRTAATEMMLRAAVSTHMGIDANRINHLRVIRRSIDARQRRVMVNLSVKVWVDETPASTSLITPVEYRPVKGDKSAVVVGAGPAGLFAALRLIELGIRPIVLERGKDVDSRRRDMALISRENVVDPDSNYCFGEGGAGAYSDGKLYTRSKKRGPVDKILNILAQHGASEDILVDAHPHIGTDKLPAVIKAMRNTIIDCGGEVRFGTRVTGLILDSNEGNPKVTGVTTASGEEFHGPVILATGHSARDVYRFLLDQGVTLEPKGLAIGVRLEHPQSLIDQLRYHSPQGRGKYLPAAEYTMLTRVDGRGVYSFCMCPGGFIIPAASGDCQLVVNGMSPSGRNTRWANSGMVVEILPEDVPDGETPEETTLKMMRMQERIERAFWEEAGRTQNAPAQRMDDFVNSRPSADLPSTSYPPGIHPARIDHLLPRGIARRLQEGFKEFDKKNRGFLTHEATLIGAETRTSSPVRIPRDNESLQHICVAGLYPCGEGAGYAGGIVSAAIDGDRVAGQVASAME
ncbi:NAD(P)/FAD-dependent oxidoreductase [uncultured Duncaniella sp.]|uniref:NAD(P)/FAD-dependent oxidoreductase n=1 Tax=uncultured Duncaniella sp. TaxID=2768039 RepID=UPI0026745EEE|nr:FAD-dependent monooxygenase [uncultured Duncaniella sp.]MCI9172145.1 FAD-binding protein [Muribaculaceae bacterium]